MAPEMVSDAPPKIPKKIWIMWLQGLEQAPRVVQECYESWKRLNPNWDITFLNEANLHEYVDLQPILAKQPLLEKQALSDIIRIKLLAQYGGVWIDATCYCQTPLDDWLNEVTETGFFAFYKPVKSSLLAAWFLAASQANPLIVQWKCATESYFMENPNLGRRTDVARWFKWFSINTFTTRYWFSYPIRKVFKVYHYYWFMYLFTEIIRRDRQSRQIWEQTPKVRVAIPERLYKFGLLSPLNQGLKDEIDRKVSPIYKLSWKYEIKDCKQDCVLDYILSLSQKEVVGETALTDGVETQSV
jgi:hypothetical protein